MLLITHLSSFQTWLNILMSYLKRQYYCHIILEKITCQWTTFWHTWHGSYIFIYLNPFYILCVIFFYFNQMRQTMFFKKIATNVQRGSVSLSSRLFVFHSVTSVCIKLRYLSFYINAVSAVRGGVYALTSRGRWTSSIKIQHSRCAARNKTTKEPS